MSEEIQDYEDEYQDGLEDGELEGELEEEEGDDNLELKAGISGWGISIIAHGIIIFAIAALTVMNQIQKEKPPIRITQIPPPEEVEEPERPRELEDVKLDIVCDEIVEDPIVTDLDLPVEETETEDMEEAEEPKGREEAVADAECGGVAAFMAIGAGGGAKGAFGSRSGGGRKRGVGKFGGSRASESAVNAALEWFKKHQSPDGKWDNDGYPDNCTDNPKCEPGGGGKRNDDGGLNDVAMTGYAVLCFLGAGFDHKTPSKYKRTVQKGIDWLLEAQKKGPNGQEINWCSSKSGGRSYSHSIATMALAEAYGMTMDAKIKLPTEKAVQQVLDWQVIDTAGVAAGTSEGGRLGWGYVNGKGGKSGGKGGVEGARQDASVCGWASMALKSAKAGGIDIQDGMIGAGEYLERAWKATNKNWQQIQATGDSEEPTFPHSGFPYTYDSNTEATKGEKLESVGALMAVFLGHTADSPMLGSMISKIVDTHLPQIQKNQKIKNSYYMYYDTLAVFQAGGKQWDKWNGVVRDVLVNTQRKGGGCFDGSWDFSHQSWHGSDTGRILNTAYCCLSLQVYYRYARLKKGRKH